MLNTLNAAFTPLRQKRGALSLTQWCPSSVSEVKPKLQQLRISRVWKNTVQNCMHGSQLWAELGGEWCQCSFCLAAPAEAETTG